MMQWTARAGCLLIAVCFSCSNAVAKQTTWHLEDGNEGYSDGGIMRGAVDLNTRERTASTEAKLTCIDVNHGCDGILTASATQIYNVALDRYDFPLLNLANPYYYFNISYDVWAHANSAYSYGFVDAGASVRIVEDGGDYETWVDENVIAYDGRDNARQNGTYTQLMDRRIDSSMLYYTIELTTWVNLVMWCAPGEFMHNGVLKDGHGSCTNGASISGSAFADPTFTATTLDGELLNMTVTETYPAPFEQTVINGDDLPLAPWEVSAVPVPEPTTMMLFALGLAGLSFNHKRNFIK